MRRVVAVAGMLFAGVAAREGPRPRRPAPPHAGLVVLIAIDQFRGSYFERFGSQFTGGLRRFQSGSALFPHGLQDHAITETAPGHATMLSGRDPAHTGIVSNNRGVPDLEAPLIGTAGPGASPRRFIGTTLYDWMVAADSDTRVLSVSRKDRGAILPVGRAKGDVYWYVNGKFVTSRWYASALPEWVEQWNARGGVGRLAGTVWRPLLPAAAYREPDTLSFENGGDDVAFPHSLPPSTDSILSRITAYPWMDSLTLDFTLEGVRRLGLGTRDRPDLLVVSLSTTDAIGHAFGPDSKELHDQILRLDLWLGSFLDSLATLVPADRTVFALTSDHGVRSMPEYLVAVQHQRAGRTWLGDLPRSASRKLEARWRADFDLQFDSGLITADVAALQARGINVDSMAESLAAEARARPGVAQAYTPRSLAQALPSDVGASRWKRLLPAGYGWLVSATLTDGFSWSPGRLGAEHGGAGNEDVEVPIAFMGPGISPRTSSRAVRTIDIGPTLAAYLGIRPTEPVDGEKILEVLTGSPFVPR